MRNTRLAASLLACSGLLACSAPPLGPQASVASGSSAQERAAGEVPSPTASRKLIRTATLTLRVEDTEKAADSIEAITRDVGGYVERLQARTRDSLRYYDLTLRVPTDRFEAFVQRVKAEAEEVAQETIATRDVTDQYVDLEAQRRTLESTENELLELLSESRSRGSSAEEIMAIYEQLTTIRTRIEQLKGRLNVLDNQVTYSTVELELWPTEGATPVVSSSWQPLQTVRRSFRILVAALQGVVDLGIYLVVVMGPLVLVVGTPMWLISRAFKRRRRRTATVAEPPEAG